MRGMCILSSFECGKKRDKACDFFPEQGPEFGVVLLLTRLSTGSQRPKLHFGRGEDSLKEVEGLYRGH